MDRQKIPSPLERVRVEVISAEPLYYHPIPAFPQRGKRFMRGKGSGSSTIYAAFSAELRLKCPNTYPGELRAFPLVLAAQAGIQ